MRENIWAEIVTASEGKIKGDCKKQTELLQLYKVAELMCGLFPVGLILQLLFG